MPSCPRSPRWTRLFLACAALGASPGQAQSESSLIIPLPTETGRLPAVTYDDKGERIGLSVFTLDAQPNGRYHMRVRMGIEGGGRSEVGADLERIEAGPDGRPYLRLLEQRSQSFEADGTPMALLRIDHVAREASCTQPGDGLQEASEVIALPEEDRVANVPMQLFFLPIARGQIDRISFQLFVCNDGAHLHDFVALRGRVREEEGRRIVEVRYGPDLGKLMSWVASRVLPKLSFWFDASADGAYLAHRMPIYPGGPEVLMVREGVSPDVLGARF